VRPEPGSNSHKKCLNSQKTVKLNKINSLLAIACMLFASINRSALHIGSFACFVQFSKVYIVAF
ncbi:hypothetical protein, partial [Enterococcus dispar]|uniref:hypothetical protein n=1 Tax=Enterococcus dispar TaxID=44009 RepID=UPI00288EEE06